MERAEVQGNHIDSEVFCPPIERSVRPQAKGKLDGASYILRSCKTLQELAACVTIQKEIWGYADREVYPLRLFVNLTKIGGHVLGAFTPQNQLAGFVASLPAWHGRHRYFHSLSLGVVREHENRGLGRELKLLQRRVALRAGIGCIEWTFDPLRAKNAYLNIMRLGAIVRRYFPDYYGPVHSRLQSGLPSDRVIAEWWIDSARVKRAIKGAPPRSPKKKPAATVAIPADIDSLLKNRIDEARISQRRVCGEMQEYFAQGLAATGFVHDGHSARYLLDRYED